LFGGGFHQVANHRFAKGWTHVAGGNVLGFVFYDRKTGKGIGGFFDAIDGEWQRTRRYG
jgi:hypothetical protein